MSTFYDYTVKYCPELAIWELFESESRRSKPITADKVQTLPEPVRRIFDKAKASPNRVQGITFKE